MDSLFSEGQQKGFVKVKWMVLKVKWMVLKVTWMVPGICPGAEWSEEGELSGLKIKVCRERSVRTTGKKL